MGLFNRIKGAVGSLGKDPSPSAGRHEWPDGQAWALLVESEREPGTSQNSSGDGGDWIQIAAEELRGVRYRFVLEVHRPGQQAYRLEREERVPAKVERAITGSGKLPAGVEVPLTLAGAAPADVEIDWDGYVAIPGRREREEHLRAERQLDRLGADFERTNTPAKVQRVRAESRQAVLQLADAVRAGGMTRAVFDTQCQSLLSLGYLAPGDHAEAVARLEGRPA